MPDRRDHPRRGTAPQSVDRAAFAGARRGPGGRTERDMILYAALSSVFPRSFTAKVCAVVILGVHLPLLAIVLHAMATHGGLSPQAGVLIWGLAATVVACTAMLFALRALLRPLFLVEDTMRRVEERGSAPALPGDYRDEAGRLMLRTNRLVLHLSDTVEENLRTAREDALTGLLNRRGFEARVPRALGGAVLKIDLDRFKRVNDDHGHATGDAVLRHAARVILASVRGDDVVARLGGEEFLAFLPGAGMNEAHRIAERIRAAIVAEVRAAGTAVTASIGVAPRAPGEPVQVALARADDAVYASKAGGRNRVSLADGS